MNKPQPQILIIWRIFLTLLALVPSFIASLLFRAGTIPWIVCAAFITLLYIACYVVYLPLLLKKITFGVSGKNLVYKTGVMTSRVVAVPVSEIRYVSVVQSVFDRLFDLASLVVTAPGSRLTIAGLKSEDAGKLASTLLPDTEKDGE